MANILNKPNTKVYDVIRGVVITEKSSKDQNDYNKYTVEVLKSANKIEIKQAFETIFKVKVLGVNIINTKSHTRRVGQRVGIVSGFKKAIITVAAGETIDIDNVA